MQPRARLEDLVRTYGVESGVISVSITSVPVSNSNPASPTRQTSSPISSTFNSSMANPDPHNPTSPQALPFPHPFFRTNASLAPGKENRQIPFSSLGCSFSPRSAGIVLTTTTSRQTGQGPGRRTIVQVGRSRDERLEVTARRLVLELESWVAENYA